MHQLTTRLNRIFENVLGCRVEFQPDDELSLVDWSSNDLDEVRGEAALSPKYIVSQSTDSFGFPVRREGVLLGLAVVHGFKDARPQRLMVLAEMMSMVLDYGVRQGDRVEKLRVIEERMAAFGDRSNVVPLFRNVDSNVLQITETELIAQDTLVSPLLTSPLLLVANAAFPLNRVAVEIHQMSGRWAFVSVEDLPATIFDSRESIEQLGGLTLFIRDIARLTTGQQIKLAEYLARAASDETPHVIAGANESVEDLLHSGRILPYLSRLFTVSPVNVATKKSASQITQELVEASLQSLASKVQVDTASEHKVGDNFIPFNAQYFGPDNDSTVH